MSLKAFSKRNPCPICNGGSDCRYSPDETLILCHGFIYDDPSNPDWHYLGVASSEVWGKFVPRRDRREYDPDKARQARIDRELKQQAEKLRKAEQALGIADRDRAIKVLAAHFGLSRKHRDDLEKRGLTPEQIEQGLFFTIQYGEPVPRGIPWNLPGVKDGKLSKGA